MRYYIRLNFVGSRFNQGNYKVSYVRSSPKEKEHTKCILSKDMAVFYDSLEEAVGSAYMLHANYYYFEKTESDYRYDKTLPFPLIEVINDDDGSVAYRISSNRDQPNIFTKDWE